MNRNEQEWFITERSKSLALMWLTRRKDLILANAAGGVGLDFIASIAKEEGQRSLRQFGIVLRGAKGPTTERQLNQSLRPTLQALQHQGPFPFPVCLFHFTMDDDQGYCTWVAEPEVAEQGPRLLMHEEPHCRKLDAAALDEIVSRVDRWYDAFFGKVAVKAS
jgi:hypothetical protein